LTEKRGPQNLNQFENQKGQQEIPEKSKYHKVTTLRSDSERLKRP
jgi:hypothetical protein